MVAGVDTITAGGWTISCLTDGTFTFDDADFPDIAQDLRDARLAAAGLTAPDTEFAAYLLQRDDHAPVLVDAGCGSKFGRHGGELFDRLDLLGVPVTAIETVILTHMHGDHVGGMTDDAGTETFANARYVTGQVEYDHWAAAGNETFDKKVRPFAEKMSFLGDGDAVVSGMTAVAAFGHTPGHMAYRLESGGEQLVLIADAANHYVWSLGYPDWEVRFDADKAAAAETRKKLLGMIAADRIPMVGYHMPFPGMGFVETRGEGGFRYVPTSYQMML